jgi:hypothetical protein
MKRMKDCKRIFPIAALLVLILPAISCGIIPGSGPIPTPTLPPTFTPQPTATPTPTPEESPDISHLVLTLADLPAGFQEVSLEEFGFTPDALSNDELTVESVFVFMEYERFEFVMGLTTLLPTPADQAAFDTELGQSEEYMINSLMLGLGAVAASDPEPISGLDGIGDMATGTGVVANLESIPMHIELVVFRHGEVGAFVLAMYLEGAEPVISVQDLARLFDARIGEMF